MKCDNSLNEFWISCWDSTEPYTGDTNRIQMVKWTKRRVLCWHDSIDVTCYPNLILKSLNDQWSNKLELSMSPIKIYDASNAFLYQPKVVALKQSLQVFICFQKSFLMQVTNKLSTYTAKKSGSQASIECIDTDLQNFLGNSWHAYNAFSDCSVRMFAQNPLYCRNSLLCSRASHYW